MSADSGKARSFILCKKKEEAWVNLTVAHLPQI